MGNQRPDLVPGTLEMLILQTLTRGEMHGYGIAQQIQAASEEVLHVEEGSLYPALQRMLMKGWVKAEWKLTENKRQARYYRLTPAGRKQLGLEVEGFRRMTHAIEQVLRPSEG
jgi:transcriptional regulator